MVSKYQWGVVPLFFLLVLILLSAAGPVVAAEEAPSVETESKPTLKVSSDMGRAMIQEAARVKEEFEHKASSLFDRRPLEWDWDTIRYITATALALPRKLPHLFEHLMEQGRLLGAVGSLLILVFIVAVGYSLVGRRRVLQAVKKRVEVYRKRIPEAYHTYFDAMLHIVASALLPLVLLGLFSFLDALIGYQAAWFQLTGRLLGLWAVGVVALGILGELLDKDLTASATRHGKTLLYWVRLALIYVLIVVAAFWAAEAFRLRSDVLALFKSTVSISIVGMFLYLFMKKQAVLSFFPVLPYRSYQSFVRIFDRWYYLLIISSFFSGLLWCLGYKAFGALVLSKIWFTAGALLAIILIYNLLSDLLKRWGKKLTASDEAGHFLMRSLQTLLLYSTLLAAATAILNLLGLLSPMQRIMSFSIFQIGETPVSFWIILKAALILLGFVFASRLLQAYLDYRVYPSLGIDPGLGYALNTFFKYTSLAIGFLISLKIVGLDLRFLLVFAGALGIGIGLGLQNMAANIISGFTIIFGGKIRKGDWIDVGGTLGTVTDIYLRATKVKTRDNIEYIIPNSDLITNTIVNYSLSSPMIRMALPVGVSYNADPREVERILLDAAGQEPLVSPAHPPAVRFIEYGDNSINFELLFWIDVHSVARRRVRSALYFAIFEKFKKAGIEIPFPQRDIHIKSKSD